MSTSKQISVCIPAYNRADLLGELLDSIIVQDFDDYEVVICEDKSPEREQIRRVAYEYVKRFPGRIRYIENPDNLGFDGNIRNIIEQASGEYCFFMGNDDLMCPGALAKAAGAVNRHPDTGIVLRSYAAFDGSPDNITQTYRYFDRELFFPAGPKTISTIYRRSVFITGMVFHRESAAKYATDRFDGTLLYQLYLAANILAEKNALYLPDILVLYRSGGTPDFGNAEAESGKFVPTEQTPESSLHFIQCMLDIAAYVEKTRNVPIYKPIMKDISNYSLPILSIQRDKPFFTFVKYCNELARMGFWKSGMFYIYFILLTVLGASRLDKLVSFVKRRLGHTPTIGNVFRGSSD